MNFLFLKRIFLVFCIFSCLFFINPTFADTRKEGETKITGIYSNLFIHEESDDLLGMEIIISASEKNYYATFQSAEGEARSPTVVSNVFVKGNKIKFQVHEKDGYQGFFEGTINKQYLKGYFLRDKDSSQSQMKETIILKRGKSFWE